VLIPETVPRDAHRKPDMKWPDAGFIQQPSRIKMLGSTTLWAPAGARQKTPTMKVCVHDKKSNGQKGRCDSVAPRYISDARCTSCSLCQTLLTPVSYKTDFPEDKKVTALALSTTIIIDIINKPIEAQY